MHVHYLQSIERLRWGARRGTLSFPCRPSRIDLSITLILFLSLFLAIYVCSLCSWRAHTHTHILTAPFQIYDTFTSSLYIIRTLLYVSHSQVSQVREVWAGFFSWSGWPSPSPVTMYSYTPDFHISQERKWPVPTRPISVHNIHILCTPYIRKPYTPPCSFVIIPNSCYV